MNKVLNKLFLTAFAILILSSVQLNAQSIGYDTTFRPNGYAAKLAEFKAKPIAKKDYVFLGNSITAGTNWSELLGISNAKNRGISGDITYGVLDRLDEIIERKPRKLFVLIGINDISRNIPDSLILNNYKKLISRVKKGSKKTQIYFYTLLPVNSSFAKFKNHYSKDTHILWLNHEIRKLADKKVVVIDLYPAFVDEEERLQPELTKDGLHLIKAGYQVWADLLKTGGYLK